MPNLTAPALSLPPKSFPGAPTGAPSGVVGEVLFSAILAKYATLVKSGKVQTAYATVTGPVIFSTAAGSGGPFIWNRPGSNVDAHILAVGLSESVASTVAGSVGFTGAAGQSIVPTAVTVIDASGNAYVGGSASLMGTVGRVATPTNPGTMFVPLFNVGTTALTAQFGMTWIDVGGAFVIPPGAWGSIAGSATLTTLQAGIGLVWAELPS